MSAIQSFDKWYKELAPHQQIEVLNHIFETYCTRLSEGVYAGPSATHTKGLYGGPSGSGQGRCPVCGK